MTKAFPPVFIINLKRSVDRRKIMTERLDTLEISHQFFTAVDGYTLDAHHMPAYAKTKRRLFFGRDLTKGEIGCLLSHRGIYQYMIDHNIETAIVLEDDAILSSNFSDVVRSIMKLPFKWDMVRFLNSDKVYQKSRHIVPLNGGASLIRTMIASGGAYGYILTNKAARVLLSHMRMNYMPVDIMHGYVWRTGLEVFAVNPSPVTPDRIIASTIGEVRFDKTSQITGWQKACHPFARCWLKSSELIGKRLFYWRAWPRDTLRKKKLARGRHAPNIAVVDG